MYVCNACVWGGERGDPTFEPRQNKLLRAEPHLSLRQLWPSKAVLGRRDGAAFRR